MSLKSGIDVGIKVRDKMCPEWGVGTVTGITNGVTVVQYAPREGAIKREDV